MTPPLPHRRALRVHGWRFFTLRAHSWRWEATFDVVVFPPRLSLGVFGDRLDGELFLHVGLGLVEVTISPVRVLTRGEQRRLASRRIVPPARTSAW
jgi:hypothetical protein